MVTICDVAQAAGVSPATVSRAFRQPGRVNVETLDRVLDVARELGYRSDAIISRSERFGEQGGERELLGLIALVVTDLENPVSSQFARAIQRTCARRDFGLMVSESEESPERELAIIRRTLPHVDGIILSASRLSDVQLRKIAQERPLAVLNRLVPGVQSIYPDDARGLREAVHRLRVLGHRQVTYLPGPQSSWQNGLRGNAIAVACRNEGMTLRRTPCAYPVGDHAGEAFESFRTHPTSSLIAFNDDIAIAFMRWHRSEIKNGGLPRDIAVVGVDDTPQCEIATPALASVRVPRQEMGVAAAERIIARVLHVWDGDLSPVCIPSSFMDRASVGHGAESEAVGTA